MHLESSICLGKNSKLKLCNSVGLKFYLLAALVVQWLAIKWKLRTTLLADVNLFNSIKAVGDVNLPNFGQYIWSGMKQWANT